MENNIEVLLYVVAGLLACFSVLMVLAIVALGSIMNLAEQQIQCAHGLFHAVHDEVEKLTKEQNLSVAGLEDLFDEAGVLFDGLYKMGQRLAPEQRGPRVLTQDQLNALMASEEELNEYLQQQDLAGLEQDYPAYDPDAVYDEDDLVYTVL